MSLDEYLLAREALLEHADPKVANGFLEAMAAEDAALLPMARMLRRSSLIPEVLKGLRAKWTEEYYAAQNRKASSAKAEQVQKVSLRQRITQAMKRETSQHR